MSWKWPPRPCVPPALETPPAAKFWVGLGLQQLASLPVANRSCNRQPCEPVTRKMCPRATFLHEPCTAPTPLPSPALFPTILRLRRAPTSLPTPIPR